MIISKYVSTASNLFVENKLCKFTLVILAIIILVQLWILNNAFRNQNTVLIPAGLNSQVTVSGYSLDENYLNAMGIYSSQLLYSFTPQSVTRQYKELAGLFSPECFQENNKELVSRANEYMDNEISMSFRTLKTKVYKEPNYIEITGETSKNILNEYVDSSSITLRIGYIVANGLMQITSIEEKK